MVSSHDATPLIQENQILSPYTTYGIGGPARYLAKATTKDSLLALLDWARGKEIPVFILGKGSNTLFDDRGFNGLVILLKYSPYIQMEKEDCMILQVGAGFSFARLGSVISQQGFSGLEFACGIPGSVGGAVYMNAGASGSDTSSVISKVTFIDPRGEICKIEKEEMQFAYRKSLFQKKPGIILDVEFVLQKEEGAKAKQKEILSKRITTQPYDQKSAGCVFRNPTVDEMKGPLLSAGRMIDEAGLKGFAIGKIEVSTLHANFIVNKGGGTAKDLLQLIDKVRNEIAEKYQVHLELEIRKVDYEPTSWWTNTVAR